MGHASALLRIFLLGGYCFLFPIVTLYSQGIKDVPNAGEIYLPFPKETEEDSSLKTEESKDLKFQEKTSSVETKEIPTTSTSSDVEPKDSGSLQKEQNSESQTLNQKPKKKKKGKGESVDPTEPPFKRGKALLTRNQRKSAETEFVDSYSKEGLKANSSRTENANLFGLDAKNSEGAGLVEKIEDPDAKIKAQFELARSLDRMGSSDSEEKAYKEYLKLVTSFPVHSEITPRTHLAIAVLLFRRQEFRPALHHLVKLMKEFKNSKEFPTAHYYAGRIYESAWPDRDLERAKKYYDLYLKESEDKNEPPGSDFRKDAKERRHLIETPLGI